jgi:hypothetical protein
MKKKMMMMMMCQDLWRCVHGAITWVKVTPPTWNFAHTSPHLISRASSLARFISQLWGSLRLSKRCHIVKPHKSLVSSGNFCYFEFANQNCNQFDFELKWNIWNWTHLRINTTKKVFTIETAAGLGIYFKYIFRTYTIVAYFMLIIIDISPFAN